MNLVFVIISLFFSTILFAQGQNFSTAFWKKKSLTSINPSNLALEHKPGDRIIKVSWTAGSGNGGAGACRLQYLRDGTTWQNMALTYNCDANAVDLNDNLPTNGWTTNFDSTGVELRLVRISDLAVMGTFPQRATCTVVSGSLTSTPTIDEDCDGYWNNIILVTQPECRSTAVCRQVATYTASGCATATGNIVKYCVESSTHPTGCGNYFDVPGEFYRNNSSVTTGCTHKVSYYY